MSKRPVQVLLEDMREATARIQEYTKGMSEDTFLKDRRTSDAVVRQGDSHLGDRHLVCK